MIEINKMEECDIFLIDKSHKQGKFIDVNSGSLLLKRMSLRNREMDDSVPSQRLFNQHMRFELWSGG